MVRLQVTAGPSVYKLKPVAVNKDTSGFPISSSTFQGSLAVRIKDFKSADGQITADAETGYFGKHSGLTWSIQIAGYFKEDQQLDDLVFGNTFDEPIRDSLPYGTALALKFVNYIDPALEQDLYADKPWAWSPLFSTMNRIVVKSQASGSAWDPNEATEDVTPLFDETERDEVEHLKGNVDARRKYFAIKSNRQRNLPKEVEFDTDFCNGFIDFNTLSVKFPFGNLQFSLAKYWNGLPVRYICCSRSNPEKQHFAIQFEIVDAEGLEGKGKQEQVAKASGVTTTSTQSEDISNDVD